jgi:predicted TIM-barrel fold metal-dependent hydrolase
MPAPPDQDDRPFRGSAYRSLADASARLAATPDEAVLDPGLPIVDAHHHLFDGQAGRYLAADFLADISGGHAIEQTVFIDAGASYRPGGPDHLRPVGETEFAAAIAARAEQGEFGPHQLCAGIVAHVDLDAGERVQEALDQHMAAGGGRLRGVRDLAQWDAEIGRFSSRMPPPHRLADPAFRAGVGRLEPMGLSFDVWVFHTQLAEAAVLADAFPTTSFILNHLGMPLGVERFAGRRAEVFVDWRAALGELARRDNVRLKLGGLGMPYAGFNFHFPRAAPTSEALADAWAPYIETGVALFGADRCMFESNFPADKQTCSYAVLWNAFKRITAKWSQTERTALFSGSARAAYLLSRPPAPAP